MKIHRSNHPSRGNAKPDTVTTLNAFCSLVMKNYFGRNALAHSVCIMMPILLRRSACAWAPTSSVARRVASRYAVRIFSSRGGDLEVDDQGRRVRRRPANDDAWDDFEPDDFEPTPVLSSGGGWDDFDPLYDDKTQPQQKRPKSNRIQRDSRAPRRDSGGPPRRDNRRNSGRREDGRSFRDNREKDEKKINMKALEGAGFVHLYGLSSVLNALKANRRDFTGPESLIDLETLQGEDLEHELKQRERKPEAQYSPWLFVQEKGARGGRSSDKVVAAEQLEQLAEKRGVPIARVDKGVLNTLSGNRPHQGYVLRCGSLSFESLSRIPHPDEDVDAPRLWLILDEVVDPQNLGALLRSAYFLGREDIGVLVCSKNSAPPSPVVSAASAGALEVTNVWSTSNLPRTLNKAQEDGFRIVGASSTVPLGEETEVYELNKLPKDDRPTLLVLGSEGSGLRTLVARACTEFVKIPGAVSDQDEDDASGVDSLNVSVTGGILLWHLLNSQQS